MDGVNQFEFGIRHAFYFYENIVEQCLLYDCWQ